MWPHFFNLLGRSWGGMMRATGTTTLGVAVWTIALTTVGWAASVAWKWLELKRGHTPAPFRGALVSSFGPGLFSGVSVIGLVIVAWIVSAVIVVYNDHMSLVSDNISLRHALDAKETPKDIEIKNLKQQLDAVCYRPDRRLTQEQHDLLYEKLKVLANKYGHPAIAIGSFKGDVESNNFLGMVYEIFQNAGWKLGDPIRIPMPQTGGDPQPPGVSNNISVTIEMETDTPEHTNNRHMAADISQAFSEARVPMLQFPVGAGSFERPKHVTVWVGIKSQ